LIYLSFIIHPTQAQHQLDPAMADNVKKFAEVYGLATQIMNLGGNILNTAGGGASGAGGARAAHYASNTDGGGNGVLGEVVKPQFRGVPTFEGQSSAYDRGTSFGSNGGSSQQFGGLFSEYGGGPLGTGSRSRPKSILDTLMGSFLGSSINDNNQPSSIFSPSYGEDYGGSRSRFGSPKQGSNIEAIVDALSRRGVKRAEPSEGDGGPTSLLSQFFGGGR